MEQLIKDVIGKFNTPAVLSTRLTELIDSLSGIRMLSYLKNQNVSEEELLNNTLKEMIRHLNLESCSIFLLEGDSLVCAAGTDWKDYLANGVIDENKKSTSFKIGEGLIGITAAERKVCHSHNNELDERFALVENKVEEIAAGSIICAPIIVSDKLLGVLNASHPNPNFFHAWQEHTFMIHANIIGMLLYNHRLVASMQTEVDKRTHELEEALTQSEILRARYEEMSAIDPLTKLYNRRFFYTEVTSGLARAKRYTQSFSLLLMDLDHFKQVNDTYGHDCGDKVLIAVSEILTEFTRDGDTLARFGGEEFVLALPETSNEGAIKLAERIRSTIEDSNWECEEKTMEIKISIGISSLSHHDDDEIHDDDIQISDILRKADRALYYVKQHGRNDIKSFSEIP